MEDYYGVLIGLGVGAVLIVICGISLFSFYVLDKYCEWWQPVMRASKGVSDAVGKLPLWAGACIFFTIPIWGPLLFLAWATVGLLLAAPLAGWMLSRYLRGEPL